jgi:hypothetical protein
MVSIMPPVPRYAFSSNKLSASQPNDKSYKSDITSYVYIPQIDMHGNTEGIKQLT